MTLKQKTIVSENAAYVAFAGLLPNKRYTLVGAHIDPLNAIGGPGYTTAHMSFWASGVQLDDPLASKLAQSVQGAAVGQGFSGQDTTQSELLVLSDAFRNRGQFVLEFFTTPQGAWGNYLWTARYTTFEDQIFYRGQWSIALPFDEVRFAIADNNIFGVPEGDPATAGRTQFLLFECGGL